MKYHDIIYVQHMGSPGVVQVGCRCSWSDSAREWPRSQALALWEMHCWASQMEAQERADEIIRKFTKEVLPFGVGHRLEPG